MTKNDCIRIFNASIRGTPVSFEQDLLPLLSDYLTENNIENSDKIISLVTQNPQLIQQTLPKVFEYFRVKYEINSIIDKNKTILYYATT